MPGYAEERRRDIDQTRETIANLNRAITLAKERRDEYGKLLAKAKHDLSLLESMRAEQKRLLVELQFGYVFMKSKRAKPLQEDIDLARELLAGRDTLWRKRLNEMRYQNACRLIDGLEPLSPEQRAVVWLVIGLQMDANAAAVVLDMQPDAVRERLEEAEQTWAREFAIQRAIRRRRRDVDLEEDDDVDFGRLMRS